MDVAGPMTYPMRGNRGEFLTMPDVVKVWDAQEVPNYLAIEGNLRAVLLGAGNRPQVVYLAGPYRPYVDDQGVKHTIAQNVREAGQLGIELWKRGYVALVPHTLTYLSPSQQRQDGGIAGVDPEVFMSGELELVRRSDFVVLMPTWPYSKGAIEEAHFARSVGIPVYLWNDFVGLDDEKKGVA